MSTVLDPIARHHSDMILKLDTHEVQHKKKRSSKSMRGRIILKLGFFIEWYFHSDFRYTYLKQMEGYRQRCCMWHDDFQRANSHGDVTFQYHID